MNRMQADWVRRSLPAMLAALGVLAAGCGAANTGIRVGQGAEATRAPSEIGRYGCGSCHTIAGITGATATVGPDLNSFAARRYIAGRLPNTAPNLIAWIRDPQRVDPGNIMPDLGVSDHDARDIAAYLYSH
jgi:cytochrome c